MNAPAIECDFCGKLFIPTPDSFVESGFSAETEFFADPVEAWKGDKEPEIITIEADDLTPETKNEIKQTLKLNEAQFQELLASGEVMTGYSCVCPSCLGDDGEELAGHF